MSSEKKLKSCVIRNLTNQKFRPDLTNSNPGGEYGKKLVGESGINETCALLQKIRNDRINFEKPATAE